MLTAYLIVVPSLRVCVDVYYCCSVGLCDVMPIKHGDALGLYLTLKNTEAVFDVIKDIGHDMEPPGSKLSFQSHDQNVRVGWNHDMKILNNISFADIWV